jgi:Leucine-rich repeat (LRR) protein
VNLSFNKLEKIPSISDGIDSLIEYLDISYNNIEKLDVDSKYHDQLPATSFVSCTTFLKIRLVFSYKFYYLVRKKCKRISNINLYIYTNIFLFNN